MVMTWRTIERPGVFATRKAEILRQYDSQFGVDNWRISHCYGDQFLGFIDVCHLFEEAYLKDSFSREDLWLSLGQTAKEVYDIDESDINSGLDYLVQNNIATHIQDIAIRNVFQKRDWTFQGNELVQIRGSARPFGVKLTPGRVPFHQPEYIVFPHLEGWWDVDSVEDFYQSNKVLQIRE